MAEHKTSKRYLLGLDISYLPLVIGALITSILIYIIFQDTQSILKERLRERILGLVSTASLQFTGEEIEEISINESKLSKLIEPILSDAQITINESKIIEYINSENFLKKNTIINVTQKMKAIRAINPNVKYVYILEKTKDPKNAHFVTDSDTVIPVDWDGNGKLDEIEIPPLPGEDYDISDIPAVTDGFNIPSVMEELYEDKWGAFLSGYAPIKNKDGKVIAVLGMDVQVDDFYKLISATLIPFIVLAITLLTMLAVQTIALVRIWGNRVNMVKELDRQKDELLSIVSHQLATPISSIKWNLEMLLDGDMGKLSKALKENIKSLQDISNNLSDLVSMILDVSRIQLGRIKVDMQELDLNIVFKEILEIIEPKAKEKKINFIKEMPKKLPTCYLDKRYTHMIVENLLSNAIKYTAESGTVTLKLNITDRLLLVIQDTGVGIPKSDQDKIFGKLFRASNVRNAVDGNGFGLYVAKGAVEAQGGKIWFESTEGKGTKFFVELPLSKK